MHKDIVVILLDYAGYSSQFRLLSLYNMSVIKFTGYIADYSRYGRHLFYNSRYQLDDEINLFKRTGLVHENYYDEDDGLQYRCEFIIIEDEDYVIINYIFTIDNIKLEYRLYLDNYAKLRYIVDYDDNSYVKYSRTYNPESKLYKFLVDIRANILGDRCK